MSAVQTNIEFTIVETSDADNVAFARGQYIIEDGSKVFYDPTTGNSVSDRIEIGSADMNELRRQLSTVYKPRGSWSAIDGIMPANNQVGDVWNLSNSLAAEDMKFQFTSNDAITIATSEMSYSYEIGQSERYTHTLTILIPYEEYPTLPDTNYKPIVSGLKSINYGISITMQGISFDSIPYETFSISSQPDGYEMVFTEYSQSSTSEFETVASTERVITQMKLPYTNKNQIREGSNIVWVEQGYWDVLSPYIDLSGYVTKDSVSVTPNKSYAGDYINHMTEIKIGNKTANNLVTADEVDGVLSTEITRINNLLGGVFHYKGSCELSDLPTGSSIVGDVWNISGVSATSGIQIEVDTDTPFSNFTCDYNYNEEEAEPSHQFQLNLPLNTFNHIPLADGQDEPDNYTSLIDEDVVVTFGNGMTFSRLIDSLLNGGTYLSINFEAGDGESVGSVWSQIYEAKTQDPTLEIEHISIPYKYIGAVKTGDNFVWAEPGYWDTLSNSVDLTNYVTKTSYANSSVGGTVKVANNTYGLLMDSGNLKISPATSAEIAAKTHEYKPVTPSQIENAVAAGTHQDMSNSYNTGNKGNLPASYTAVKGYVDSSISSKISNLYKLKGSIYSLPASNMQYGDVWNLLEDVGVGDIQVITHLAAPAEIEASSVSYSYAPGSPGFNRHQIRFDFDNVTINRILDTLYGVAYGVTLKIDNYTFNTETYEDCVVDTEEGYIIFYMEEEVEYGEDSIWKSIADNGGTITQLDIPYENKKVIPAGNNVVWIEPGYWDILSNIVDLSSYATKAYVDGLVGTINEDIEDLLMEGV